MRFFASLIFGGSDHAIRQDIPPMVNFKSIKIAAIELVEVCSLSAKTNGILTY